MALDRWYVSGALGVNTAFDEPTDQPSPLSIAWAMVGSAISHTGGATLNLMEGGAGEIDKGPTLNWWALNPPKKDGVPSTAVRLASIGVRFSSLGDGKAAGYLKVSTKSSSGDVQEALRITDAQDVGIGTATPRGRLSVVGRGAREIDGGQAAATFATSSGSLAVDRGRELKLASFGFHSGNATTLAIRARRTGPGTDWTTTAVGLGIDVDDLPLVNNSGIWLHARGGATINGVALGTQGEVGYPYPYESVGVDLPWMNLRLQSPNAVIIHARGAERCTVDEGGLRVAGDLWAQGAFHVGPVGTPISGLKVGSQQVGNSGNRVKSVTVGFGAQFMGSPRVIAAVRGDGRRNISDTFAVSITDVTPTEFAANICRVDTSSGWGQIVQLDWMAWE